MSSDINLLLEKATSPLLLDIDWDSTLHIVDLIRQGDVNPKAAVQSLVARLKDSNPNVVLLALQVFESVVKNCGQAVHEQVATRGTMEQVHDVLQSTTNDEVRKRILMLLATWVHAFRNEVKYRAVQDTVNILKAEGHHLPTVIESDAMFTADRAPDWADGECCHRCRSQFTMLRRKHHCRACGQVFCGDCSSKYSTIPKFGIEREVRVCESCYEDINNSLLRPPPYPAPKVEPEEATSSPKDTTKTPGKKTEEELQEEEELQLALALSRSDAENKEKEKLRATSSLLGGNNWRQQQQPSPTPSSPAPQQTTNEKDDNMDPELARYLNRSYWEGQQQQTGALKTESITSPTTRTLSPTHPSAPISANRLLSPGKSEPFKVAENYQNGETEEVDEFVATLRTQLEIFVNRMKSNQSRGRPIANDTSVQTLFMNITAMHAQLLKYIHMQDDKRVNCERLQDKISQVRDARAALEALREEHRDRVRREQEEQERIRQMQMMQKLEIMRKKKQEYLEYQRQLALHRMAECEREIFNKATVAPGGIVPVPPQAYPPMGYPQYPGAGQPPGSLPPHMFPPQPEGPSQGPTPNPQAYQPPPPQYQPPPPGMPLGPPGPPHGPPGPPQGPSSGPPHGPPGMQGPPPEFAPYNMQGLANNLPNVGGGGVAYPGPGAPGMAAHPPQMPPVPQQQLPPPQQPPMAPPPQPTGEEMGGGGGPPGGPPGGMPQAGPPSNNPPTPQDQQAELISFD